MGLKKLVVIECEVTEPENHTYEPGEKYSYFQDPETGKFYRPKPEFTVTGDNLDGLFVEITDLFNGSR